MRRAQEDLEGGLGPYQEGVLPSAGGMSPLAPTLIQINSIFTFHKSTLF